MKVLPGPGCSCCIWTSASVKWNYDKSESCMHACMDILVAKKTTMKNHSNHWMVQLYLSAVTCLLFLDIKMMSKGKVNPRQPSSHVGRNWNTKLQFFHIDEHDYKNCWTGKQRMRAMSLEQSWSIKNCLVFFPYQNSLLGLFSLSVETRSWNRDRLHDKLPVEFQCLDELVIQLQ